jgi:hypothetical protein
MRRSPVMKHCDAHVNDQMPADLCGDTVMGPKPPANLARWEQLLFALRQPSRRASGCPPAVVRRNYFPLLLQPLAQQIGQIN